MADIVDPETRSRMMSGIRSKDTKPELFIRKALHAEGFRYRLHAKYLPGKPDLVFPKYKTVILVHGCFWHGHNCNLFKLPKTRTDFWENKIKTNQQRDHEVTEQLHAMGWRTLVIWECVIRNVQTNKNEKKFIEKISRWLGKHS